MSLTLCHTLEAKPHLELRFSNNKLDGWGGRTLTRVVPWMPTIPRTPVLSQHNNTHTHAHTHTHARAHTGTHTHPHTNAHNHTHTRTQSHTHTHTRKQTHTHTHTHCEHTHTHREGQRGEPLDEIVQVVLADGTSGCTRRNLWVCGVQHRLSAFVHTHPWDTHTHNTHNITTHPHGNWRA